MASETSAIALRSEEIRKEMPVATASGGAWPICHMIYFLLSPRNALRWGYSNAAVVPCVRACVCASVRASVRGPCEHDRDYTVSFFFVKLGRHVNHDERMNTIDFGGQRSRSQWTCMEISL